MTKKIYIISTLICLLATMAKAQEVKTYTLNVNDFSSLQVIDDLNVVYRNNADSAGMVTFRTDVNDIVSAMVFTNNKNKLRIEKNLDNSTNIAKFPVITVYSSFLQSVENFGDSSVTVNAPAPCEYFKAKVIGNGSIIVNGIYATQTEGILDTGRGYMLLEGTTKAVKLKNVGTGMIDAAPLKASTGTVSIFGTGHVKCNVENELTIKGMGTGKIYLVGNPKVKKRSLGSIRIVKENDD